MGTFKHYAKDLKHPHISEDYFKFLKSKLFWFWLKKKDSGIWLDSSDENMWKY